MNDKFIYIYDVECKQSFIINTQQIVWIDINSQSMMMSASSDKGLFHLDEESTKAIIEVVNKGAKNCCHGDYSKQVGGRYISEDTVIEWLKDQDIIKTSGQEKEARKQLSELPSVAIPNKTGHWIITYPQGKQNPIYECPCYHASNSSVFKNYCPNCGCRMVEPQERSDK